MQRNYPLRIADSSREIVLAFRDKIQSAARLYDFPNQRAVMGLCLFSDAFDFVDSTMIRCLKAQCSRDNSKHVSSASVLTMLKRWTRSVSLLQFASRSERDDAQHADLVITQHWLCNRVWTLADCHGYILDGNKEEEMQPSFAVTIAKSTIRSATQYNVASLEVHGNGLVSFTHQFMRT